VPEDPKKARGGSRPGAGRRKTEVTPVTGIDGRTVNGQEHAQWLIDRLHAPFDPKKESVELAGWRRLWDSLDKRIALECRRYLYDRAKGKATVTVNHLHDKPIELNVNHSMSEIVRKVRLRKEEYARRA
jgi:hypothetical protein